MLFLPQPRTHRDLRGDYGLYYRPTTQEEEIEKTGVVTSPFRSFR